MLFLENSLNFVIILCYIKFIAIQEVRLVLEIPQIRRYYLC
jgi:hypothetical protein